MEQTTHPEESAEGERTLIPSDDLTAIHVLVGIPAYNEEVAIGSTVLRAREYADAVVVVDDGSSDRTASIARRAGAEVIVHPTNQGKGAAIATLLDQARAIDPAVLVLIDGDGQHDPTDIPSIAAPAREGHADLVIGNRHHLDRTQNETPMMRRVGQRILDAMVRFTTGTEVTDTQSGFRALSSHAIQEIDPQVVDMGVESEMIHTAAKAELRITEVPINVRYDGIDGQTHHPVYHGLIVGIRLLTFPRSCALFGIGGAIAALVGIRLHRGLFGDESSPESDTQRIRFRGKDQ